MRVAIARGHLSAAGEQVDAWAERFLSSELITPDARARRVARDGPSFHITLASRSELKGLAAKSEQEQLLKAASEASMSGIALLGLGTTGRGSNKCWFVALMWPEMQSVRAKFAGLGHCSFHITLGFDGSDVHGCPKGAPQLIPLEAQLELLSPLRSWVIVLAVARDIARSATLSSAENLAALERLEEEAKHVASAAVRSDLICSWCELQARLGALPQVWASHAETAVQLDGQSARARLMLGRARLAERRMADARDSLNTAVQYSESTEDHTVASEVERLLAKLQQVNLA